MQKKVLLEKVTVRLRQGDIETLDELFPAAGYNKIIRNLVMNFVDKIRANANHKETINDTNITIE